MNYLPAEIIKKKRGGESLLPEEIDYFVASYTKGSLPDYQMSALLMAIFFKGLNPEETLSLTKSMLNSGVTVDFSDLDCFKVDKHSTGGVGDKTSLILGPIVASLGLAVPMISGRGLGHTGGTLDKLESIPGFNTQLTLEAFKKAVKTNKICFIGQTKDICPADKKIYALRDVTGTVESQPLICASILSKKLAEGIDGLVLDVKYGSGAFMKDKVLSEQLALALIDIAKRYGKKVSALITNMDQPLGQFAGNSLEVFECLEILKNKRNPKFEDTRELSLQLAAKMLELSGQYNLETAYTAAEKTLNNGKAYEKFEELCVIHSGRLKELPQPKNKIDVVSTKSGFINKFHTEKIGMLGIQIKAGRSQITDLIEPTAGIEFHGKVGDKISAGDPIFSLYGADKNLLQQVSIQLLESVQIHEVSTAPEPLIWKVL